MAQVCERPCSKYYEEFSHDELRLVCDVCGHLGGLHRRKPQGKDFFCVYIWFGLLFQLKICMRAALSVSKVDVHAFYLLFNFCWFPAVSPNGNGSMTIRFESRHDGLDQDSDGILLYIDGLPTAIQMRYKIDSKLVIFRRKCYSSLYKKLRDSLQQPYSATVITGMPSIGKSIFSVYTLILACIDEDFPTREIFLEYELGKCFKFTTSFNPKIDVSEFLQGTCSFDDPEISIPYQVDKRDHAVLSKLIG